MSESPKRILKLEYGMETGKQFVLQKDLKVIVRGKERNIRKGTIFTYNWSYGASRVYSFVVAVRTKVKYKKIKNSNVVQIEITRPQKGAKESVQTRLDANGDIDVYLHPRIKQ